MNKIRVVVWLSRDFEMIWEWRVKKICVEISVPGRRCSKVATRRPHAVADTTRRRPCSERSYVRSHPHNSNMLSLIAKVGNAARPRVASSLQIATMATHAGTVKWFNAEKGFGFITPDGGKADIFVHHTGILTDGFRSLAEEERVEFDTTEHNGKIKAINVTGPDGAQVKRAPKPRRDDNY